MRQTLRSWKSERILAGVFVGVALLAAGRWLIAQEGEAPRIETPADAARKKELIGDADAAVKLIAGKKYHEFLETYAPVEVLRELRRNDAFTEVARELANDPEKTSALIKLLRGVKTANVTFEAYGYEATVEYRDADSAEVAKAAQKANEKVEVAIVRDVEGFGGDLPAALKAAQKALEDEEFDRFVVGMYPISMIEDLDANDRTDSVVEQLTANKEIQARLSADLTAMAALKPELSEDETVATFVLRSADENERNARPRTVKMQKTGEDWRFFDGTAKVKEVVKKFESAAAAFVAPSIRFEKIGGNWRFISFEGLGI